MTLEENLKAKLLAFKKAALELTFAWDEMQEFDQGVVEDFLQEKYPFIKSFDEEAFAIKDWVENSVEKMDNFYKNL